MWSLARKILVHDRVKFFVAAAGVSVSVLLVLVQVGLYLGFMQNASNLIDRSTADIWVAGEGNENFDFALPFDEALYYRVEGTPGVELAEPMLLAFGQWKMSNGGAVGVQVVGLKENAQLLKPAPIIAGDPGRIAEVDGIIVDKSEFPKLLLERGIGERQEITGVRSRIIGLSQGLRSFTTSPFVFANMDSARAFTRQGPDKLTYALVRVARGARVEDVMARIDAIPGIQAFTKQEFSEHSRTYWSKRTGVGVGFFMTAALGVIIGLVVVGQILYNGTLEHIREYGTLKAMGARNSGIVRVILYQALISAAVGFVMGGVGALLVREGIKAAYLHVVLSPPLLVGTALLTIAMCAVAALLSITKVLRLDPATVFKG
ncbi:MAG: FtsX-like permease family protein [Deltaproteobacteria bacterium]|nr:FtsX-like permease family protein [Deltaproteobacteria bacterium]